MEQLSVITPETAMTEPEALDRSLDFSEHLKLIGLFDTSSLYKSLDATGIACPLLATQAKQTNNSGRNKKSFFTLLDGFKRLSWAQDKGLHTVPVIIINSNIKERLLFLISKHAKILDTCIAKALFLKFLLDAGFQQDLIVQEAMEPIELQPYKALFERYLRVADLPPKVLAFCHKKDFSLKRCLNLTYLPKTLLLAVMDLEGQISLSASLLQELCDTISEVTRREEMEIKDFFELKEIKAILSSDKDRTLKTNLLRQAIRKMRFPTLTKIQNELKKVEKEYLANLPLKVVWDNTLENRKLTISAIISSEQEFYELERALSSSHTKKGIKKLLSYF